MEKKRKGPKRIRSVRGAEVIAMRKLDRWLSPLSIATIVFYFWGFFLVQPMIISTYTVLLISSAGGLLMLFIFRRRGDLSSKDWSKVQFLYFIFGASVGLFSIPAINHYAPRGTAKTVQLEIERISQNTHHGCRYYAHVVFDNVELMIRFDCDGNDKIQQAKMVELQVEKGALGYYIYTNQSLVY